MTLVTPTSTDEALAHLAIDGARCIAGGQSLVAMLNAGLIEPTVLVSLRGIDELARIEQTGTGLRIGAMVPHAAMASYDARGGSAGLLVEAARQIGYPAIRNQGTIGGSVCHADPAADYPVALTCAEAVMTLASTDGKRDVAAADFFAGMFETAVQPGELLTHVTVPVAPRGVQAVYEKFSMIHGDFAAVSVAALIGIERGVCSFARIAIGACASAPVRVAEAEAALVGSKLDDAALDRATVLLQAACDPIDDHRASAAYRLKLVPRLVRRAVQAAAAKAEPVHA
jgi:carbon-monoxide dehydrogenase medium subunit